MPGLVGTPSDDVPDILANGRCGISTVFISMSARHPEGKDAEYIEWHSLDHRPEQYRLADPAETGHRLRGYLEKRWANSDIEPVLAAPFHLISNYEWDRYLP